jgi:hypothetical protein
VSQEEPGTPQRFDDFGAARSDAASASGFFRGSELSSLLVLLTLMFVGWALVWTYLQHEAGPPEEPEPSARATPPRVEPDASPAFESVTDRTPIGLRDMAAYDLLLKRAREVSAAELARKSHGDLFFTDLWERPEHYRGVPVHLLGTARRVHSYESNLSPKGRLYEAWISTHESQGYPYVCIFEDLPEGMPVGPDLAERVVFNGYFLKEMRYLAGKEVQRAAPVLIGKIGWTPGHSAGKRDSSVFWMALIVAILFVISLFRWIIGLRRSLARRSLASSLIRRPTDEIAPDDLAHWVESVQEGEGQSHDQDDQAGREDERP